MIGKPKFEEIKNYEEFAKYFWYEEELNYICAQIGCNCKGNKDELQSCIKDYFESKVKH